MTSSTNLTCPLDAADRRLRDGLNLWVETKSLYFYPDRFRLSLNNVIQTLRNVTFVLQKSKSDLNGFDDWYSPWQERMRNDEQMRWLVDSRNVIVKQGDLETYSRARVSVVDSWFEPPKLEIDVPPFTETGDFERLLATNAPTDMTTDVGLLKVERRWVDSRLPSEEILGILAHAFDVLFQLLHDAHMRLLEESDRLNCVWLPVFSSSEDRLPRCMLGLEWDRTLWIDLRDGSIVSPCSTSMAQSEEDLGKAARRYDGIDQFKKELSDASDLKSQALACFNGAKNVLKTDGAHVPIAILSASS